MAAKGPTITVSAIKFDRTSGLPAEPTLAPVALRQAKGVLLIGAPKAAGMLLKTVRTENQFANVYTLWVVGALALVKDVGAPVAQGLLMTQVMPNPRKGAMGRVRDDRAQMEQTRLPLGYTGMEGYLTARVLFEALGRIKGAPSRDKLMTALEEACRLDVAGFAVGFSRKSHEGSRFADRSLVSASGPIIDWVSWGGPPSPALCTTSCRSGCSCSQTRRKPGSPDVTSGWVICTDEKWWRCCAASAK